MLICSILKLLDIFFGKILTGKLHFENNNNMLLMETRPAYGIL